MLRRSMPGVWIFVIDHEACGFAEARVGIQDEYYFSRLFLKHTGQRPLAYSRDMAGQ